MKMRKNIIIFLLIIFFFLLFIIYKFYFNYKENYKGNNKESFIDEYTAIIVEPRKHKALSYVLHNFLINLSDNWNIIIMCGNNNKEFIENILENELYSFEERITLINLNVDNLTIDEYNNLLKSKDFYNNIPTEIFLIFQTDSVICEENKDLINKFINNDYDYVGAPWSNAVGNGGLSLRKKSKMLEIIEKCPKNDINEDIFFANSCINTKKPSIDEAKEFSVESLFSEKYFGVHKPWNYLNDIELKKTKNNCKSLNKLIELNK